MKVNVACGDSYIKGWVNFDYAPNSKFVHKANLLKHLPLKSGQAELVYCSHFIEHIPRHRINNFLSECYRVLQPGGVLRLVLPDFFEMCSSYIKYRGEGENVKADFLILEIIDQCVRTKVGGELGEFYTELKSNPSKNPHLADFVKYRTGENISFPVTKKSNKMLKKISNRKYMLAAEKFIENIQIKIALFLLPSAFRDQNVSFADVGERHTWVYDFYTLSKLLKNIGFSDVRSVSETVSRVSNFPFYPLDLYEDGSARKGKESMYIEAVKLST